MRVLLLGATGNLGSRVLPALLAENHNVTVLVRSASKLSSLHPASTLSHAQFNPPLTGDATSAADIKRAILSSDAEAVVNCAGLAALFPWQSSDLPKIVQAVVTAAKEVVDGDPKRTLRVWILGGMGALTIPNTKTLLGAYLPLFKEHAPDLALLQTSLPPADKDGRIKWSMLCPSMMTPASASPDLKAVGSADNLVVAATHPPLWRDLPWLRKVPVLGEFLLVMINAPKYNTTLEDNAAVIARDLAGGYGEAFWGTTVGVVNAGKNKSK